MKNSISFFLTLCLCLATKQAHGADLQDLIASLYGGDGITLRHNNYNPAFSHHAHFTGASLERLQSISNVIAQVQTPALVAPAGIKFVFDPILDDFVTAQSGLGPVLGNRPETIGSRRWSFGLRISQTEYDKLNGQDLSQLQIDLQHLDIEGQGPDSPCITGMPPHCYAFEKDVIRLDLDIDIASRQLEFSSQYGLTDRWDVGIAIPVIRHKIKVRSFASIINDPSIQYFQGRPLHVFDESAEDSRVDHARGANTGLGDIAFISKYAIANSASTDIAMQVRLRLPTGDQKNLRGIDQYGADLMWIAARKRSLNHGLLTFRGNIGMGINAIRNGQDVAAYLAGVEYDRSILGRQVGLSLAAHGQIGLLARGETTLARRHHLAIGVKMRLPKAGLASFALVTPLNEQGLRATVSYAAGIEWTFH